MNELSMNELYDIDGGVDAKVNVDIKVNITGGEILQAAKGAYKEVGKALHNTFGCTQCWFK